MQVRYPKDDEKFVREIPDEGWFDAVCVDAIDDGLTETRFGKKPAATLVFQLGEPRKANNSRFLVFHKLWFQVAPNGDKILSQTAIKLLVTWQGKRAIEAMTDLDELVGKSAKVKVIHRRQRDATWVNLSDIEQPDMELRAEPYTRPERKPRDDTNQENRNGEVPF
jgi:hypothetical protein